MPDTAELKLLKRKRANLKGQLTRFDTFLQAFTGDYAILKTRLEQCQKAWPEFYELQAQIEVLEEEQNDDIDNDSERALFEDAYFKIVALARNLLEARNANQNIASSVNVNVGTSVGTPPISSVQFPKINLPIFSGNFEEFMTFNDSFNALIHVNPALTDIERFHYLRSSLKGDAAQIISGLETTSSNYQAAWTLLQERYDNKRLIIHNHVKALFELTSISKESHAALRQLLDNLNKHLRALESLKEPVDKWDTLLVYLMCTKLDNTTRREWEIFAEKLSNITIKEFTEFLNKRCNLLQTISFKKSDRPPLPPSVFKHPKDDYNNKGHQSQSYLSVKNCLFCKQGHKITMCDNFLQLAPKSRYFEIKRLKLCTVCLGADHPFNSCDNNTKCNLCNKKHHTLLHFDSRNNQMPLPDDTSEQSESNLNSPVSVHHSTFQDNQVLLSTAIVFISDATGRLHECKILLDSGSQSNFVSKELCDKLKLSKQKINIPISGLGQARTNISYKVDATIKSKINNYKCNLSFLVIDQITDNLPLNFINFSNVAIPQNIKLADPFCNIPSRVDALLGASIFWELLCVGQIKLSNTQIIAQKTKLGWILSGQVHANLDGSRKSLCHFSSNVKSNAIIERQLEKFWQIEHCEPRPLWSSEQRACEDIFVSTYRREEDGRFLVQLPLRQDMSKLGDSKQMALKRFYTVEKKLTNNTDLRLEYVQFMEEYLALGHMSEVSADNDTSSFNYLPHHCVVKDSSTTTRVRVVFDASAKTDSGISLNDLLMTGPTIQSELFAIMLKFRKHRFVLTADCAKMYRQINVQSNQRRLQAILWRSHPDQQLKTYVLNTVTYGTSCAPFLAVRCLHQLAADNQLINPFISNIIKQDFYVDDLICGADTLEQIINIKTEVTKILAQGKFELHKWRSNESSMSNENQQPTQYLEFSENKEAKMLGIVWNSKEDMFQYNFLDVCVAQNYVTKRTILSYISKIFDPLGLIGPIIIKAKIMLQHLWQLSLDWDESVPQHIFSNWKLYQQQIHDLKSIAIIRHITCSNPIRIEMHTFCDASESAYGACTYIRSLDGNGMYVTHLLCAKSRVAPLKNVTLPRLELSGALLAARLSNMALKSLDIKVDQSFYWCDSSIALTWILDEPCKWKIFVGNRVAEIQELTEKHNWKHIRSEDNPGDIISRGINPNELVTSSLWWHGPKWLEYDQQYWPASMPIKISEIPERKTATQVMVNTAPDLSLICKYSSFLKLQRVVAYIIRFKNNALRKNIQSGPLSVSEMDLSLKYLLRMAQSHNFSEEINSLKLNNSISKKSKLFNLNPFIDTDNLLRVGGRLKKSDFDYDLKHPVILPKGHPLTKLIITYEHRKLLHAGAQALLAHIRSRFWPIAGRNEVRKILSNCVICFKVKPVTVDTLLGQLPLNRITPSRPFLNCGVDYAGPFFIKAGLPRSKQLLKTYLCVFVCLSTKALHLELVSDLTTNAFLNAFKRFISRRGKCSSIYSDNGTTFVGANHELTNFLKQAKTQNVLTDFFVSEHINWNFIPPRSPHFGGIWESAVKAVKYHLRRVVGNVSLTYEEFNTIITQVEACLNSRPLSPLSADPEDLNPLTPGHFLIGSPLVAVVEPDLSELNTGRLNRYQHLTQLLQHFWKRWSRDYITELQQRSRNKGSTLSPNVTPGTMVLLVEDNAPPLMWPVGRVESVHFGSDGIVRVANVKTAKGLFKRAVRKLCVLPIAD